MSPELPLSDILSELYPPKSPYEFSVIGIEILGEVCEQFLGKVIRLTAGHQALVEERSKGLVPTRALDGSSAPRKLSAMPCEPRPALTEVELFIMSPGFPPGFPKKQSPSARQLLDQKLAITDQQVDALVYELYGLTEDEIRIVEGAQK